MMPIIAPPPPRVQLPPPPAVVEACDRAPAGTACTIGALRTIDAARAREGLGPIILPRNWASLSPADQLLVLTDLERTARGLPAVAGVTPVLDQAMAQGAAAGRDPDLTPPPPWIDYLDGGGGAWASTPSIPLAWYLWMYYDGPGSGNVDCPPSGGGGCWGHRNGILMHYRQTYLAQYDQAVAAHPGGKFAPPDASTMLAMDGAVGRGGAVMGIVAMSQMPPLTYTWAEALAEGAGNPATGWNPATAISRSLPVVPPPNRRAMAGMPHPSPATPAAEPRPANGGAGVAVVPQRRPAGPVGERRAAQDSQQATVKMRGSAPGGASTTAAPRRPPIARWLGSAAATPWELAAMLAAAKRILGGGW